MTKQSTNPMKWPFYIGIIVIFADIAKICLAATTSGKASSSNYLASIDPVSLFRIVTLALFLVFHTKRSKYAWAVLLIIVLVDVPLFWTLRWRGFHFEPSGFGTEDLVTFLAWLVIIIYVIRLRKQYMRHVSTQKANRDAQEIITSPMQLEQSISEMGEGKSLPKGIERISLQPQTQIRIGQFGAALALAYNTYCLITYRLYMLVTLSTPTKLFFAGILYFAWGFVLPAAYFLCLSKNKLRNAAILFPFWIVPLFVLFVFRGFQQTILRGNFSEFMSLWGPFGFVSIFLWIGKRGIRRTVEPNVSSQLGDTLPSIFMYPGALCGLFVGGKIAHNFLASHWPDMPSYEIKWVLACLGCALAGAFLFGWLSAWVGVIGTAFMNETNERNMA